jgi:electron transport complex protein RnfD
MAHVLIALAPAAIFGVIMYGLHALLVVVVCIAAAAGGEALFRLIVKRENRMGDLSAVVSGLLLALVLPPSVPLWMAALGAVFATVVVKEFFGGIGANVFNPALTGRAFLLMSFPAAITSWTRPMGIFPLKFFPIPEAVSAASNAVEAVSAASDAAALPLDSISGATPLGIIKMGGAVADVGRQFAASGLAGGTGYLSTLRTLFFGWHSGTIGESSILLILAGCFYLLVTRVIDWRAPLAMIASSFVLLLCLGMDPVFGTLAGGLLFGAVFMTTDYTTAPLTSKGKLIFGAGAGIITVLIRRWGNFPEGVTYGILIMNAATPFLNRLLQKKYGYVPPQKKAKNAGASPGAKADQGMKAEAAK